MNEILSAVYRRDEYSLAILLQDHRFQDRKKIDETLRIVLCDTQELTYHERLHFAEMLLCAGADPNVRDWNNEPMLSHAVKKHDMGMFQMLMNFAPNVDACDDEDRTVMHVAAELSNHEVIGYLMSVGGQCNSVDEFGNTPLMVALMHDPTTNALELLTVDTNINASNCDKESALHIACLYAPNILPLLLSCGATVNSQDVHGETPLMWIANEGDCENAKLLIEAGADINKANLYNYTPLHKTVAAQTEGDKEGLVNLLILSGADVNARSLSGSTALFMAVEEGNIQVLELLLYANANVNMKGNAMFGKVCTPLDLAILRDDLVSITMLLIAGCQFRREQLDKALAHFVLSQMSLGEPITDSHCDLNNKRLSFMKDIVNRPQPLSHLCRKSIRTYIGVGVKEKLETLFLPQKIKNFICLDELEDII